MCNRYTLHTPINQLAQAMLFPELPNLPPRYNIAPTQQVAAVRPHGDGDGRELVMMRWGLIPFWTKSDKPGRPLTIARSETVDTASAFRECFRRRRCLMLADGFYEWQQSASGKGQPYYFRLRSGEAFAFAAIWDRWRGPDGVIESCALTTTGPNELMRPIHDRMPVILAPADHERWLDPERPDAQALLRPCPAEWLEAFPVDPRVGSYKNDDQQLIEPLAALPTD